VTVEDVIERWGYLAHRRDLVVAAEAWEDTGVEAGEVEAWLARDPLTIARERLIADGATSGAVDAIHAAAAAEVAAAEAEARAAPEPAADDLERQVWADGGSSWRN